MLRRIKTPFCLTERLKDFTQLDLSAKFGKELELGQIAVGDGISLCIVSHVENAIIANVIQLRDVIVHPSPLIQRGVARLSPGAASIGFTGTQKRGRLIRLSPFQKYGEKGGS